MEWSGIGRRGKEGGCGETGVWRSSKEEKGEEWKRRKKCSRVVVKEEGEGEWMRGNEEKGSGEE